MKRAIWLADERRVPARMLLSPTIVGYLEELAAAAGTVPSRIVEVLVERGYAARAAVMTEPCPWRITESAIADARRLLTRLDRDATIDMLEAACVDASLAEREGRRKPTPRGDTLQYRGPKPHRLTLTVARGDGGLALIRVSRSG